MGAIAAIGMGALSVFSAASDAKDIEAMGQYQKEQYEFNARIAEVQAKDAIERGDQEANALRAQGRKLRGAQRAAMAAQGIQADTGSGAVVQADSAAAVEHDIVTIKNNAWREAWGYRAQALSNRQQGVLAAMGASNKASNTLLTGGIQAIGYGAQAYGKMGG